MRAVFEEDLRALQALSSDRLAIDASFKRIVFRWSGEVTSTLFEACAHSDRPGGATLDRDDRTLTVSLRSKAACRPGRFNPYSATSFVRGYWLGQ